MTGSPRTLLSYAFRPFFLLNGVFAILVMVVWVLALHGAPIVADPTWWHAHEMLVGFAGVAIAGFVLTAVATWTGRPPVRGMLLSWLVIAWLAGRLAMGLSGTLPAVMVAVVDMCFPVLLCVLVTREVIAAGNRRNYPIAGVTALLAGLNLLYHLGSTGAWPDAERTAVYLLIHLVLLLITVIAGRIVPSFTANWLRIQGREQRPESFRSVEGAIIPLTALAGLADTFYPARPVTASLALAAAAIHGLRLSRWCGMRTVSEPLLFILHVAYAWLPAGYALLFLASLGWTIPPTAALHALTMGGVGTMVLAVTTRVALGHTGRPLRAARLTVLAYAIMGVAVVLRVLSPMMPRGYQTLIDLGAAGWIASFALFLWVYWPVLTKPRVDGNPG